jgi:hypothetical protein
MVTNVKSAKRRLWPKPRQWPSLRSLARLSGRSERTARPGARGLAERVPGRLTWQGELAATYEMIADELRGQGRTGEAIEAYLRFFAIAEELADRDPGDRERQIALVASNWKLASLGDNAAKRLADVVTQLCRLKEKHMLDPERLEWLPKAEKELARAVASRGSPDEGEDTPEHSQ